MKGLKKIALASAIAAVAAGAQAELKALDDSAMSELTGQAGLTIDLETEWTIGEFAYQDAGFLVLSDLSMGGNSNEGSNSMLDNIRMEIDVAGAGGTAGAPVAGDDNFLKYGFSNVKNLAAIQHSAVLGAGGTSEFGALAQGSLAATGGVANVNDGSYDLTRTDVASGNPLRVDDEVVYGDGDLKIHFTFTDAWQKGGGFAAFGAGLGQTRDGSRTNLGLADLTLAEATDIAMHAVDFEFGIGKIGLASSTYDIGSGITGSGDDTTILISDLSMKGYLGPADIHIENNGNGFGADGSGLGGAPGTGNADSKIHWDSFFKITDLEVYIDIVGVKIDEMSIHNNRGDLSSLNQVALRDASGAVITDASGNAVMTNTTAFGFAHSKRDIYAVKDSVLSIGSAAGLNGGSNPAHFVDGIAINTQFKGDIDIGHLSFGDTDTSIGKIYMTDVTSTTNWTISAH